MYNPKSLKAEEFINHQEILDTLAYADAHKDDLALVDEILEKAKLRKGLSHREASVLLACNDPEKNKEIMALAEQIKKTSMVIVLLCLRHCICQITASMAAYIAHTMQKTNTLPAKN